MEMEPEPYDSVVGRVEARLSGSRSAAPVEAPVDDLVIAPSPVARAGHRIGLVLGAIWFAIAVQLWLAIAMGRLAAWGTRIPSGSRLTGLVAGASWRWTTLLALIVVAAGAHVLALRGRRWVLIAAAVSTLVVVGLTAFAISYRVNELTAVDDGWTFITRDGLR